MQGEAGSRDDLRLVREQLPPTLDRVDDLLHRVCGAQPIPAGLPDLLADVQFLLHDAPDVALCPFSTHDGVRGVAIYDRSFVDEQLLRLGVLRRLAEADLGPPRIRGAALLDHARETVAPAALLAADGPVSRLRDAVQQVLEGNVVLGFEGCGEALSISVEGMDKRAIAPAPSSPSVIGPRDGFIEDASTNLNLVRRRLRTPDLCAERFRLGTMTGTAVYLLFLRGVCDPALAREARRRLAGIRMDGVLESNYVREMISDSPRSIVPTIQRTERPDVVAAALLEGRLAIVVDGTPFALLAPVTLLMLMQVHADYYEPWVSSTIIRTVRIAALAIGVFLPAVYVAVTTYQHQLVPLHLLMTLAASRENVPLPTFIEVFLLLALFEVIREAGVRIPSGIGQALTIGGTLVVGEAAVRAGIVSSPIIIIASTVVIAFFAVPDYDLLQLSRFLIYPMLFAAGVLGAFGLTMAAFALAVYLASIRSFGVGFLEPFAPMRGASFGRDAVLRAPWQLIRRRPAFLRVRDRVRQPPRRPHPPGDGA